MRPRGRDAQTCSRTVRSRRLRRAPCSCVKRVPGAFSVHLRKASASGRCAPRCAPAEGGLTPPDPAPWSCARPSRLGLGGGVRPAAHVPAWPTQGPGCAAPHPQRHVVGRVRPLHAQTAQRPRLLGSMEFIPTPPPSSDPSSPDGPNSPSELSSTSHMHVRTGTHTHACVHTHATTCTHSCTYTHA